MRNFLIILFASCFLFTLGCSEEDTIDVVLYGSLKGKVVDKLSGEPIKDVKITTNPASTTVLTDTLGEFKIDKIAVGDYSVQAEAQGYVASFEAVSIKDDGLSEVSFELSLSTTKNFPPSKPILVSPEDGAVEVPLSVTFIWEASDPEDDELSYILDLRNGTTDESQIFEISQDTSYTVQDLQLATKYFWQVTVTDGVNDSVSSSISEFKTLVLPDNPFIFVREKEGNLVIYSGDEEPELGNQPEPDYNVLQITSETQNSFRPRKSNILERIAFMRNSGGNTHLFTMKYDGTDVRQITSQRPIAGFRTEELSYTWALNDSKIYYPNFDRLYSINYDGTGTVPIYQTTDGSFISEVAVPEFDDDLVLLKTNDSDGYNVRIFTVRLSTGLEETVILENEPGAAGGIDITANADRVLYFRDKSGSESSTYRIFEGRLFVYNIPGGGPAQEIETEALPGENDLDPRFSPSEGGVAFTRVANNFGATPSIYTLIFGDTATEKLLFTDAFMPDWE